MSLSYWVRLLLLCFASFFVVHMAASLAVYVAQSSVIRFAERLNPRAAARLVLALRFLPFVIALASVIGLCAPSYLRFEQDLVSERVGPVCLTLTLLGILVCVAAADNGLRSAASSIEFARLCLASGQSVRLRGNPSQLLVIPGARPFLAQSGIFKGRIVISQRLLRDLSPEELAAALSHERGHWISRDNLKRLFLAFLPDALPLWPSLARLERSWAKFAERAADDYVLAAGDAPATSLASALVCLARIGGARQNDWSALATSPFSGTDDLSGRVNRLLYPEPANTLRSHHVSAVVGATTALLACCVMGALWPAALSSIHELLELLIR